MVSIVFEWDRHNLRKIRAHRLTRAEVEDALSRDPILVYEQDAQDEIRYVYYSETPGKRMIAVVLTERGNKIRVITAYDLEAGQKQEYMTRRERGE
jgi:uncharacterized DUF497 family protein